METVVYAGRIKNRGVLNSSSSGGAFTALSDLYLENGDAVIAYGNSLFLIHTTLGETLFDMIKGKLDYRLSNTTQCWQENLARPTNRPEMREEFWSNYYKKGIDFIVKKYGTVPIKAKIKKRLLKIMGYTESNGIYAGDSERRAA